jgi:hypothetical protein
VYASTCFAEDEIIGGTAAAPAISYLVVYYGKVATGKHCSAYDMYDNQPILNGIWGECSTIYEIEERFKIFSDKKEAEEFIAQEKQNIEMITYGKIPKMFELKGKR